MFIFKEFYEESKHKEADIKGLVNYINGFKEVILWGAGNLGNAIQSELKSMDIKISAYWDINYEKIIELNGVPVKEPFAESENEIKDILIIVTITRGCGVESSLRNLLEDYGYEYMNGLRLNEALICPFKIKDNIDSQVCLDNLACSQAQCRRYFDVLKKASVKPGNDIFINTVNICLTLKCTLKCKSCNQDNVNIPKEEKNNYPLEKLLTHIDNFLDAIDGVATIGLIGGEPFLYPHLDKVVDHLLTKDNFGSIQIITNGIWKYDYNKIKKLKNDRVSVFFSDYTDQLSVEQVDVFNENKRLIDEIGIRNEVMRSIWYEPLTVFKTKDYTVSEVIELKQNCLDKEQCSCINMGIYSPCAPVASNLDECVDLDDSVDLRNRLRNTIEKKFYRACYYCNKEQGEEIPAGVQISEV